MRAGRLPGRWLSLPGLRQVRGVIGLMAGAVVIAVLVAAASQPPVARVGDHWHASYLIVICGKPVMPFPYTPGNVHTHGDGFIHVHPAAAAEAGRNATLARFFDSAGAEFSKDHITLTRGVTVRNGDRCADGSVGQVRLIINGRPSRVNERYTPTDGDTVLLEFGPLR